jgi:hypothetical protein
LVFFWLDVQILRLQSDAFLNQLTGILFHIHSFSAPFASNLRHELSNAQKKPVEISTGSLKGKRFFNASSYYFFVLS